jgi:hypothetical protein
MKTSARTRLFCTIILLLISWTNVFAQDELGPNRLLNAPAPTLSNPSHLRIRLRSPRFVASVGGVAFGATAVPAGGSNFANVLLSYRPEEKDGNRLWITVDRRQFPTLIYDWQLIPIAKFADSPYKSCVTLFGELNDREEGRRLLANGDGVLNYHPAFVDTLLGLRLFQLDILIDEPYATDLPKQSGRYILGSGEAPPDSNANIGGWNALSRFRERLRSELRMEKTRSYVITDEGRDVRFSFDSGGLNITGEPYIYFWLSRAELPGYNEDAARGRITGEVTREAQGASRAGRPDAENEAYITMLLGQLNQDEGPFEYLELPPWLAALKGMQGDLARRTYLRRYTSDSVRNAVIELRVVADADEVVPLTEYSDRISGETDMLRRINPVIWDTGVNVMRYAAFFRYYKAKYPSQWQSFLIRLSQVPASPQVRTPAIMKRGERRTG